MTITEIKKQNREAGQHFFEKETMQFFDSRIESSPIRGHERSYFVTSEQFRGMGMCADGPRKYTVRVFDPRNGKV